MASQERLLAQFIADATKGLDVHEHRGLGKAVKKPLLLLLVLAHFERNPKHGARFHFSELEDELGDLITRFGGREGRPRPNQPYQYLDGQCGWTVRTSDGARIGHAGDEPLKLLRSSNTWAELSREIAALFMNRAARAKAASAIIAFWWPQKLGQKIRDKLRLPEEHLGDSSALSRAASVSGPRPKVSRQQWSPKPYAVANEAAKLRASEILSVDPAKRERGCRGHARTQNALATLAQAHGQEVCSPGPGTPDFDLAWLQDGQRVVVEVKSLTAKNETSQLRMGLGQVLQYRHTLKIFGDVRAVLALERRPVDPAWELLCNELGVVLTWAPDFPGVFVLK
jgi:hypothetical protein